MGALACCQWPKKHAESGPTFLDDSKPAKKAPVPEKPVLEEVGHGSILGDKKRVDEELTTTKQLCRDEDGDEAHEFLVMDAPGGVKIDQNVRPVVK